MANIQKIKVNSTPFDIEALHFKIGALDTPEQWKQYIDGLASIGTEIKVLDSLPPLETRQDRREAYLDYCGDILLIEDETTATSGIYIEYVGIVGDDPSAGPVILSWEKIGTTSADLADYVKYGVSTTSGQASGSTGASSGNTGATSDASQTTSSDGGQNASGYIASALTTDSKTDSVQIDKHTITPAGVISGTITVSQHGHATSSSAATVIKTVGAGITYSVIKDGGLDDDDNFIGYEGGTPTLTEVMTGFTTGTTPVLIGVKATSTATVLTGVTYATTSVFNGATVDANGVLSFGTTPVANSASGTGTASAVTGVGANGTANAVTSVTKTTTNVIGGVTAVFNKTGVVGVDFDKGTVDVVGSITYTTVSALTTLSVTDKAAFTVSVPTTALTFTGTTATLSHTQNGSNYNTLNTAGHTHGIPFSTLNLVTVAVSSHTHTVTIPGHSHSLNEHTHSLNNHTHSVTFTTPS